MQGFIDLIAMHAILSLDFPIYRSSHLAILPTRMLVLVSLIKAKCFGLDDRPEKAGVKYNSGMKQGSQKPCHPHYP